MDCIGSLRGHQKKLMASRCVCGGGGVMSIDALY